jgi:hypothetical protein
MALTYHAPQDTLPPTAASPNDINQLHVEHELGVAYQGVPIGSLYGTYKSLQTLAGYSLDQPFFMAGTELDRVALPLNITNLGADVTVSLYADTAGAPSGSALAQYTIPASWILGAIATNAPSLSTAILGPISTSTIVQPPSPATGWGYGQIGTSAVLVGGTILGNQVAATWVGALDPEMGISTWTSSTAYPLAIANLVLITLTDNGTDYVIGLGGYNSGTLTTAVYASSIANGVLNGWKTQPSPLPVATELGFAFVDANNNVYYCEGYTGSAATANVYVSTFANGVLGAWTTLGSLPVAAEYDYVNDIVTVNGWTVLVGGTTSATLSSVYGWKAANFATLQQWPSLPMPLYETSIGVIGNNIIVTGGSSPAGNNLQTFTLTVTALGPANAWVQQPSIPQSVISVGCFAASTPLAASLFVIPSSPLITFPVYTTPMISAPLQATGLSSGNKYHLVLTCTQGIASVQDASALIVSGSSGLTANLKRGAGSWTALTSGYSMPYWMYCNV